MPEQSKPPEVIAPKGQSEAIVSSTQSFPFAERSEGKGSKAPDAIAKNAVWYLGIDLGTTGISAVLLNSSTGQRYPIYWSQERLEKLDKLQPIASQITPRSSEVSLSRLPTAVYSGPAASKLFVKPPITPIVVGCWASELANHQPGVFLENFKSLLNLGIPYHCPNRNQWEPILQLPSQQMVSLYWVRQALQMLFATLTPNSTLPKAMITVGAKGLDTEVLTTALQQLQGVILGCPAAWGDTYRFNLRETVLAAKLVQSSEQIFFVEDAIASILAGLPPSGTGGGKEISSSQTQDAEQPFTLSRSSWHGGTLVINSGASTTELALVDLPDDLQDLTYNDVALCSLPYAGHAIDQDIFCQLLYPKLSIEQQQQLSLSSDLELPQPNQPELQRRDRLAFLLQRSPLGKALLKAASCLKIILQHKDHFTLDLGKQRCTLTRQDLEDSVVQPFVQLLNQTLKALLIETGISEQGIYQVLLLGGTANLSTLTTWIQKRFPNATLIQDANSPDGNWVAAGLATLPLYPQVFNRLRQQYSDYFLLLELLRAFPETTGESVTRAYRLEEIMQQLERRGLNTGACYERLVRLVDGHLPDGLVPSMENTSLLAPTSKQNPLYSKIAMRGGLFSREDDRLYRRNLQQQEYLNQYLKLAFSGIYQKFDEPLILTWDN
jgi:hypothetical protein